MESKSLKDIILVSGGFDPVHSGHIFLIQEAAIYGDVIILLNSDNWLKLKKGKAFLTFNERKIIMNAFKHVIDVIAFNDNDKTCVDGIKKASSSIQKAYNECKDNNITTKSLLLKPFIGITEATSQTLMGLHNGIYPSRIQIIENRYGNKFNKKI